VVVQYPFGIYGDSKVLLSLIGAARRFTDLFTCNARVASLKWRPLQLLAVVGSLGFAHLR
jgi:hypothetical protein